MKHAFSTRPLETSLGLLPWSAPSLFDQLRVIAHSHVFGATMTFDTCLKAFQMRLLWISYFAVMFNNLQLASAP